MKPILTIIEEGKPCRVAEGRCGSRLFQLMLHPGSTRRNRGVRTMTTPVFVGRVHIGALIQAHGEQSWVCARTVAGQDGPADLDWLTEQAVKEGLIQ